MNIRGTLRTYGLSPINRGMGGIMSLIIFYEPREPLVNLTGDDIPDVLVGMLSQTGFKVMQKCDFLPTFLLYLFFKFYW